MPGCDVYANSNAVACKGGHGKVVASFPDVCLSPPSPPAGPIPVPYPDTSFSKDMKAGSKTVKIKMKEVMLKDKSYYKSSPLGDEAATRGLGAGVISHVITGKTYFVAWSMDVKVEGKNVDRHIDLTTSNHASLVPNESVPWVNMSYQAIAQWEDQQGKCACCDQPQHPGRAGAAVVSEDEWYGLNENIPNDPEQPDPRHRRGMREWEAQCAANQQLRQQRSNRERWVQQARRNGCMPEPPCNVYRILNADQRAAIEEEWDAYRPTYQRKKQVAVMRGGGGHETVNHLTPRAAGGCPIGDNNLKADRVLSEDKTHQVSPACREALGQLDAIAGEVTQRRDAGTL